MKTETRLRKALLSNLQLVTDAASEIYLAATDYEQKPVDKRYRLALSLLRRAAKNTASALNRTGGCDDGVGLVVLAALDKGGA